MSADSWLGDPYFGVSRQKTLYVLLKNSAENWNSFCSLDDRTATSMLVAVGNVAAWLGNDRHHLRRNRAGDALEVLGLECCRGNAVADGPVGKLGQFVAALPWLFLEDDQHTWPEALLDDTACGRLEGSTVLRGQLL